MSYDNHHEWLSLIEISGPFLAVPVLKEAFPQGLEELDGFKRKRLRQAYDEWREAQDLDDPQFPELHAAWIDEVLSRGLELDEDGKGDVLKRADWCASNLKTSLPEHGTILVPDFAVVDEQQANKPMLLIQAFAPEVDLDATHKRDGWAATPADRMVQLCRSLGCRLGLVSNGERWMLVDAPVGAVTTFASWYARIWSQEPITIQAFVHLLGIRRFFVDESEQLPALFDRSLKFQDEVTDALGEQVRRAVEVLIQSLDKADQDRNRELLHDVKEPELYEAALTVMMRLVFLLSAEERSLLLMGDERYEANYALSTLRMQLRKESEEILERRWDAWSRLLAIFRAVYGGIEHENLRLPALGGSLFDPDRFPFLEGRAKGSNWRTDAAKPLPIDNRTVLLLLEAIQQFQGRTLSYRALDVEQIGYVYEGLLERTVKRTDEVTLELDATKSAKTPWVKLAELDSARLDGADQLAVLLQERSGSSASRVRNDLAKPVDDTLADRLLTACLGDTKLRDRVKPYAHLLRTDPWGYPLVYPAGAFIVTTGSDRRETGTHYTPKSLTEAIVTETLTPVAYVGPAEGTPRDQWVLKSPAELLDLKICDPAMGSGAFLVQACRWLSDRLVEAWAQVEASGKTVSVDGEVLEAGAAKEPLPRDSEARTVIARRLIAERCLYGVDLNPLAVELAKLSIWLVTLAKGRPFGFLDHNLRSGDSLLGIHRLDQISELSMNPTGKGQQRLFGRNIEQAVKEAVELRKQLRAMPIRDIHDVEAMARLDFDARKKLEVAQKVADLFIGEVLASNGSTSALENGLASLAIHGGQAFEGDSESYQSIVRQAARALASGLPVDKTIRCPFHWPLEFPEVFIIEHSGFDAIVGNPPFMGGKKISGALGANFREFLVEEIASGVKGNADLCAFFFLRAACLIVPQGVFGMLATNTISQGDTREVCLDKLLSSNYKIIKALPSLRWPGKANLEVAVAWIAKSEWEGDYFLNDVRVPGISSYLVSTETVTGVPFKLRENDGIAYVGQIVLGDGFVLTPEEAESLIRRNAKNKDVLFEYLSGKDFTSRPDQSPSRWVINFFDWPLRKEALGFYWKEASQKQKKQALASGVVPIDYPNRVAADYPDCLEIIEKLVKPQREKSKRKVYRERWWLFAERQPKLIDGLESVKRVLFHTFTGKYVAFAFTDKGKVFAGPHNVILLDHYRYFSVLQSTIHYTWVREYGSTMKNDIRYATSDVLKTFPFPDGVDDLENIGQKYYQLRAKYMEDSCIGLTETYNAFNDPDNNSETVQLLRSLHIHMDQAVLNAYGWSDIRLEYGFYDALTGVRFTYAEESRREILKRLLELNHNRNETIHSKMLFKRKSDSSPKSVESLNACPSSSEPSAQTGFDFEGLNK